MGDKKTIKTVSNEVKTIIRKKAAGMQNRQSRKNIYLGGAFLRSFLVAQMVKNTLAVQEARFNPLGWGD